MTAVFEIDDNVNCTESYIDNACRLTEMPVVVISIIDGDVEMKEMVRIKCYRCTRFDKDVDHTLG